MMGRGLGVAVGVGTIVAVPFPLTVADETEVVIADEVAEALGWLLDCEFVEAAEVSEEVPVAVVRVDSVFALLVVVGTSVLVAVVPCPFCRISSIASAFGI